MKRMGLFKTAVVATIAVAGAIAAKKYLDSDVEKDVVAAPSAEPKSKAKDNLYIMDAFRDEIMGVDVSSWISGEVWHTETMSAAKIANKIIESCGEIFADAGTFKIAINAKSTSYPYETPPTDAFISVIKNKKIVAEVPFAYTDLLEFAPDAETFIGFRRAIEADIAIRNRMKEAARILAEKTGSNVTYQDVYPYNAAILGMGRIENVLAQHYLCQFDWDETDGRTSDVQICQKLQNIYKKSNLNAVRQWKEQTGE